MTDTTDTAVAPAEVAEEPTLADETPTPAVEPAPVESAPTAPAAAGGTLGRLADVTLDVTVELGRTRLPVRELLALDEGGVIRLDHPVGEPVNLLVNGLRTARGEIVVVDGRIGLRVTEVVE